MTNHPSNSDAPANPIEPSETSGKRRRGRVRLIVGVVALLLLAAVAIPNFVKAQTTPCKSACISNLFQIDGAIEQWSLENEKPAGAAVTLAEVAGYLKPDHLKCPGNGVYSVSVVGAPPVCSHRYEDGSGHSITDQAR